MNNIYSWTLEKALKKLDLRQQVKNPVMFVVYLGASLTSILYFYPMNVPL